MAAVILTYNQPGYIDRHGVGASSLDKQMEALRLRFNKTVLQGATFFRTVKARGGAYRESNYGNGVELPRLSEDSGKMPFASPVPGFTEDITISTYRLGIAVERAFAEDDLMGTAKKRMSGLLRSGKLLPEYAMAAKMNNLTSTATAYVGADGVAVASNSHPQERRETGTWSNIETGAALDYAAFTTARTNMRKRTDEFGYKMMLFPKLLVVGPENEGVAKQIQKSEKVPDNANNAINAWRNDGWEVMVYDYMTSTTAWMLYGDMPEESKGLLFAQAVPASISPLEGKDMSTDIIWGQRLRMRFGTGVLTERNLQYNAGA